MEAKLSIVPAPEGFIEASSQIPLLKERFVATESENNDFLAIHILRDVFAQFQKGNFSDLDFYTKVSVSKRLKNIDYTEADFMEFVRGFKTSFPAMIDTNGQQMKTILKSLSKNLTEIEKRETTATLSQPINVGLIEESRNAYGIIILTQLKISNSDQETNKNVLAGMSVIRMYERLIFLYTYKVFENEQSINELKQFSKRWLTQTIAANSSN